MIIHWHQNPFMTRLGLDERDHLMILNAYQNEEYSEILCRLNMGFDGTYGTPILTDVEDVKDIASGWADICNLTIESERIQAIISYANMEHMGDCICVPCSCMRCQVEEMLGINTLKGLGKHPASKVQGAYGKDGSKTIDEAIAILATDREYRKPDTWPDSVGYEKYIPRWENERLSAVVWLKAYKEEHGF